MTGEKPKQGAFDTFIHWLCIAILLFLAVREFSHLYRTPDSIENHPGAYESHLIVSASFPFIGRYFLMKPLNFDPSKRYPLMVVLQGRSPHIYAADTLARESLRAKYPGFVLVPIAPVRALWETPANEDFSMPSLIPFPDAMPQVMDEIESVMDDYPIDSSRIYLTGHSMGGMGVVGALQQYPDVFAGGLVLSGLWDPKDTDRITAPIWMFHGAADPQIPVAAARLLNASLQRQGKPVIYDELDGLGHDSWRVVYESPRPWTWLYAQRKAPARTP